MGSHNHSKALTPPTHEAFNWSAGQSTATAEHCGPSRDFHHSLYATMYTIVFVPGLLANSVALWVLCRSVGRRNKTVLFMVNLAAADLVHVLSLPLRIYYYVNYRWPFGHFLCQLCFYLKYLNMYASICFLTCISIQRYFFLLHPFRAKGWKRRYDAGVCVAVWAVAGAACLSFPLLRSFDSPETCFTELRVKAIGSAGHSAAAVAVAEVAGFFAPLAAVAYCTWRTKASLRESRDPPQSAAEKRRALRMVAACAVVFFVCFGPYHVVFFFFMMVKEGVIRDCAMARAVLYLHPFCLSLASFNCCLDPVLYFFTTSEFRGQMLRHSSLALRSRLMSKESMSSFKE